ncbi:Sugar-transfer associated ATP-grasp [Haloechinothrix alba]|uniref:Sugar-transfer associated ATP-grasp n=1 Tax=Haloechinothrix alba TaxID=664784 RepID=A0A238UZ27_9PSEU|nr:sugar-transfer associated ATP-grasp domain-containing protein [Haloechinothrix alba]SNR27034.1 Sugar-transfer associated ATP-grasp [Haloechinothrix alba]
MTGVRARLAWSRAKAGAVLRRVRRLPRRARHKVRDARLKWSAVRKLAKREREWDVPLRMRRPRWWLRGFLSRSVVLYDLDRRGAGEYISDLQRVFRLKRMVHPLLQDVINNKLTTHLLLGTLDVRSAKLLGVFWRGAVHAFPIEGREPIDRYLSGLEVGQPVFFKVLAGAEGKNLFKVQRSEPDGWVVNGEVLDLDAASRVLKAQGHPMVVEEGLDQHPKINELFPDSVNTIRVLTMLDVRTQQPFIVMAVQRIGTRRSRHVDNWSRGGLSARIDVTTGQLGQASRLPDGTELEWFDTHPDTGAPIRGAEVPYWPEIREMVLHSARILSFMEYVGWDIVVTPDGPVVLEANINTGMNVLQVHQPLLSDARARAYYVERGVAPEASDTGQPVTDEPV